MQFLIALLFVVGVAGEEVSQVQPVVQTQPQVVPVHSAVEQPAQVHAVHQPPVVVVGEHHHANDGHQPHGDHFLGDGHQHHYAPAGLIQAVGAQPHSQSQSQSQFGGSALVAAEQYGKPESSALPPNYKPFGSWGLYIGGNPADGYYSSYYKALGNTVDKQQVAGVEQASGYKPAPVAAGQQSSAFPGPLLKQASYPYNNYDQVYPFDYYTPADLNSGSRVSVLEQSGVPSVYAAGPIGSPAQVGAQVYGVPAISYAPEQPAFGYAPEHYAAATKRVGAAKGPERVQQPFQQQQQQQQVDAKGYKGSQYAYAHAPQHYASFQQPQQPQQPQVVAYPVPVGSQIVGSQPGADGAYAPYGVHGYTRYAVKPTVVSSAVSEQHYSQGVHSSPVSHFPVYKQQVGAAAYQPLGFYGYPLNQLHYSQNSLVPAFGQQQQQQQAAAVGQLQHSQEAPAGVHHEQVVGAGPHVVASPAQVEAASSEKSETLKLKEQKRA